MPCLKPTDGTCSKILSNKITSQVVGAVNLALSIFGMIGLIFKPGSMRPILEKMDNNQIAVAVVILLINALFAIILMIGLNKDRRLFVKAFIIFCAVLVVLLIIGFVTNLFMQPVKFGFIGFFTCFIDILVYSAFFCVVRSYYLATYS